MISDLGRLRCPAPVVGDVGCEPSVIGPGAGTNLLAPKAGQLGPGFESVHIGFTLEIGPEAARNTKLTARQANDGTLRWYGSVACRPKAYEFIGFRPTTTSHTQAHWA